ncbi:MAG: hemerythrin domain-containing protein [Burkholderiales bacterium]
MRQLIGANAPAADFEHPLEMLAACHERIEDRIETLERLVAHLPEHGCDEQAQQAARNVMRYFDTAGEHHHQDEERDLFPALARLAEDSDATALVARLLNEHAKMRALWQRLRSELEPIAQGTRATLDADLVKEFGLSYRGHIALEESQLLPLAARLLADPEKNALGASMARRRAQPIGS